MVDEHLFTYCSLFMVQNTNILTSWVKECNYLIKNKHSHLFMHRTFLLHIIGRIIIGSDHEKYVTTEYKIIQATRKGDHLYTY